MPLQPLCGQKSASVTPSDENVEFGRSRLPEDLRAARDEEVIDAALLAAGQRFEPQDAHAGTGGPQQLGELVLGPPDLRLRRGVRVEGDHDGADAFASDLNPVAVLLNKVVLEYIPKYGQRLADEVRKWGQCVKDEAKKELAEFYPKDPDGATPIAYLWARTILSESPEYGELPVQVPMLRTIWLAKSKMGSVALQWKRSVGGDSITETINIANHTGAAKQTRRPILLTGR